MCILLSVVMQHWWRRDQVRDCCYDLRKEIAKAVGQAWWYGAWLDMDMKDKGKS